MKFSKDDLIKYRLEKAFETFDQANLLAENGYWNAAASKLYYSCFYIVNAIFVKKNIITKSHAGAKNQFHLHFIKSKILKPEFGVLYNNLFSLRQLGDYEDFIIQNEEDIAPLFEEVRNFPEVIKNIIITREP